MEKERKLAVVALGGNALLRDNQLGTIIEQEANATATLKHMIFLIEDGYDLVITHGNGPQVGSLLMQNDAGEELHGIPQMPLNICVAETQGEIGFMIERMLRNILIEKNIDKAILTLVTQVVVDEDDPAFKNPTKRIGRSYTREQAKKMEDEKGWVFKRSTKTEEGWRRVVASPMPKEIFNRDTIGRIARQGAIVIAGGGGGIPVYKDAEGKVRTVDAVIDKDFASSLLASRIGADEFYILTDVPYVYRNFGEDNQEKMEFIDNKDGQAMLDSGVFGEGSMAPKVRAALYFINHGGDKSVITEATRLDDRSYGTKITMEYDK
ncbi:carbamate kinase [Flavobacteriales bacterium AH-315-E23]|nr:carbamate kinase [Flavobacteriales bacterium AH-315-E23]